MGTILVALGIFLWFGFTMITFVFLTPETDNLDKRLGRSVKFNLTRNVGLEFGVSLMKVTGIFWVIIGLIMMVIGDTFLQGIGGDIILGVIFLAPVWIGAMIAERRRKGKPD